MAKRYEIQILMMYTLNYVGKQVNGIKEDRIRGNVDFIGKRRITEIIKL